MDVSYLKYRGRRMPSSVNSAAQPAIWRKAPVAAFLRAAGSFVKSDAIACDLDHLVREAAKAAISRILFGKCDDIVELGAGRRPPRK